MLNNIIKFSAAAGLIALAVTISGCGGGGGGGEEPVKFKLGIVDELNPALYGSVKFKYVKVSADNKRAYVLNEKGALFAVDLKDGANGAKEFHDKNNWKRLTLKDETNKDGTTAGKAKLNEYEPNPEVDRKIAITENGVVVLTNLNDATTHARTIGAVAYFKGLETLPTYAWTNAAVHAAAGTLANNRPFITMAIVKHQSKEFIVVLSNNSVVSSVEIADAKQFTGKYTKAPNFAGNLKMVANTDKLFFVDESGLTSMPLTDLGTTKVVDAVDAATAGSDNWRMFVAGAPIANNDVQEIALLNDKIFISFYPGDPLVNYTGGIAVYDIKDNKTLKPDQETWNKVSATNLLVHNNKLQAIVNGVWIGINDNGGIDKESSFAISDILNNKFKKDKLASADLTKPLYRFSSKKLEDKNLAIELMVPVGNDFIMQMKSVFAGISADQLTIHYEDKEIEVKKPAEKKQE
jgi:hypothetical protein